VEIQPTKNG
jgi:hypothetical protein